MHIPAWFQATRTGTYAIGCAELCGLGHYKMKGTMTVHSAEEWTQWLNQQQVAMADDKAADAPPADQQSSAVVAAAHSH
jgi:cytochrome c oxidase subunit 2